MKEIFVKSATAIVKVVATSDVISAITTDEFFYCYIPSVQLLEKYNFATDGQITINKSDSNLVEINYPNVVVNCQQINNKDIISIIEYVLERARQEKGVICIHGAGALVEDKLVVCWGTATGMGKTTLALKLSEGKDDFYSDEKILIDLENATGVGRISHQYVSNNYWKNKLGDKNYHPPKNLAKDLPYQIGVFVHPIICEQQDYEWEAWQAEKFAWHLYEESSRKIRGTSRTLFNNSCPVMSLDTKEISQKRLTLINDLAKKIPALYFKGKADKGRELINTQLKNHV